MFLITTADERFWRREGPVVFLGEWCRLFSRRAVWGEMPHEVLPYHWDDRERLHRDHLYLDGLYERVLARMREVLNDIHGVDHSARYWRIVAGPWLYYFIQILYDRYQSIVTAAASGKVTNTLIARYGPARWLPASFPRFQDWSKDDDYNHYLYGRIIESTGTLPFEAVDMTAEGEVEACPAVAKPRVAFRKFLKSTLRVYQGFIPDRFNQVVLVASYLHNPDLIKLQLSLGQFPYIVSPEVDIPSVDVDPLVREKISLLPSGNEFETLLAKMIKEQIPRVYVEGYALMNARSLRAYPRNPRVILTANAYSSNESYKFWSGYNIDRGAKLAGTQHGGLYGIGLWMSSQSHEIKINDVYYTWGWKSDAYKNTRPLAAAKLNTAKKTGPPKKDGRILLVLMLLPRYFYRMYSVPVAASGLLSYFNDQFRFTRRLSPENQALLLVRLHRRDNTRWDLPERWQAEFPRVERYLGKKTMFEQLRESRLVVCTYNSTTYLEAFTANFPTVVFWDPKHWEMHPAAQPYFDELHRAGIFHYTPESAAELVNTIADDPSAWWRQPKIQKAKEAFCAQFARTSDDWLTEWRTELSNLKKTARLLRVSLGLQAEYLNSD